MFKYNEKWYKKCCKCLIVLCFINCDKSKRKMTNDQVMEYVNDEKGETKMLAIQGDIQMSVVCDSESPTSPSSVNILYDLCMIVI